PVAVSALAGSVPPVCARRRPWTRPADWPGRSRPARPPNSGIFPLGCCRGTRLNCQFALFVVGMSLILRDRGRALVVDAIPPDFVLAGGGRPAADVVRTALAP